MKPITLHAHPGPNPWKVAIILEELSLPYETKVWATADQKKPPFTTTLNPNGFTPVIEDPNTNIILWESGAIIEYLLETYDTNHLLTFPLSAQADRAHFRQYFFFQGTFQGPNLSNAFHFLNNKNPTAQKRFAEESIRVLGVLEGELARNGETKEWLVGGRCTAADLVFVPYSWNIAGAVGEEYTPDLEKDFPNVAAWLRRMGRRETVKKVLGDRTVVFNALLASRSQGPQK